MLFDILWLDGVDLTRRSTEERREVLTSTIISSPRIQIPASFEDGAALLEAARAQGLEGVVAKRIERPYQPGKRSPDWRKVKVRNTQEFVVGGWLGGGGTRAGTIGSLVIGCHVDGNLTWVGNVGTGFSTAELRRLSGVLAAPRDRRLPVRHAAGESDGPHRALGSPRGGRPGRVRRVDTGPPPATPRLPGRA